MRIGDLAGRERLILAVMFALSAIGFAYEVLLTRLFSLIFQYHYVFLIVSVSIAGMSLGAALAVRGRKSTCADVNWVNLTYAAVALSLALPAITIILSLLRS